ncbi:hypothetical protein GCM10027340_06780 [Marinomonas epiphytica]
MSQCVCSWLPTLFSPLEILVVQDSKEARHAKNTVSLLKLALPQTHCIESSNQEELDAFFGRIDYQDWRLIFPSEDSKAIEGLEPEEKNTIKGVIFIDATWRKAKKMYLSDARWHSFKTLNFSEPPVSNYEIRKKPSLTALSTLEACAYTVEELTQQDMTELRQFMYTAQRFQWRHQPSEHKHINGAN